MCFNFYWFLPITNTFIRLYLALLYPYAQLIGTGISHVEFPNFARKRGLDCSDGNSPISFTCNQRFPGEFRGLNTWKSGRKLFVCPLVVGHFLLCAPQDIEKTGPVEKGRKMHVSKSPKWREKYLCGSGGKSVTTQVLGKYLWFTTFKAIGNTHTLGLNYLDSIFRVYKRIGRIMDCGM